MRIITGRAGSGKTTRILAEITQAARAGQGKQLLLVPELYSHDYERRLAAASENHGARTAEVVTFSRLTGRIFAEVGGLADTVLTPAGRLLTVQEAVRRVSAGLRVYTDAADRAETIRELLRAIDELKCYNVAPEKLFEVIQELDPDEDASLSDKLRDLGQIATMYDRLCTENLPDPRDALSLLAARLPDSHVLDGTTIYLDAFSGLTPQELAIVEQMLRLGLSLTAAITCDESEPEIFVSGCKLATTLHHMAERMGLPVERLSLGESRQKRPADLALLERKGLLPIQESQPSDGQSVQLYAAVSPFDECEHAAAMICRRVREEGARYRDFTIAARDMSVYSAPLQMAMKRYQVPVFISEKTDLMQKPPIALVTGALETVTGGWRYEDFFACLKTGLCVLTPEEIDRLENYVLTWRIQGSAWCKPFTGHPDGYGLAFDDASRAALAELNVLRERASAPFAALAQALESAQTAAQYVIAVYEFLERIDAPHHMEARADAHEAAGRLQLAEEYRQLWEIVVSALEQFAWVCGEVSMDTKRFAQLLTLVLGEYDVGTIPISLDRVTCGSLARVTGSHTKHLIVLGVNDGVLPQSPAAGGILTESDRLTLDNWGVKLSAMGAERMLMEQEVVYHMLACPMQSLLLCWHEYDAGGAQTRPSYLIGSVRALLEGVPITTNASVHGQDRLEAELPCVELACAYLSGANTPASRAAYAYYQNDERVRRASSTCMTRGPLTSRQTVAGLYGHTLNLTASRIDTFYSCRFAFFMQYGLRAKARHVARFDAPEAGTFIHYVLENALNALSTRQGGIAGAAIEDANNVMQQYVRQYIQEQLGGLDNKTARFRYLFRRLIKTMESILENVLEELRVSDFTPIDYELDFSRTGDLPPVAVSDGETQAQLSGKVDRVDGYIKDGRLYVRIMDYKSGKKAFSLSDIWYGLNMQLVLYLYALQDEGLQRYRDKLSHTLEGIVPAGVLYVPARDELLDADREEDEAELRTLREKLLRRSGLLIDNMDILEAMEHGLSKNGRFIPVKLSSSKKGEDASPVSGVADLARLGRLARYAQDKLLQMAHALAKGDIRANPYCKGQQDYCQWCEFRAACQFDESMGDRIRMMRAVTDEEFWKKMEGGDSDGNPVD